MTPDTLSLVERLDEIGALEGVWYANVGAKTARRVCETAHEAAARIRDLEQALEASRADSEKIIANAVWLYRAACSGISARDVKDGRCSEDASRAWSKHAIEQFEEGLRALTGQALTPDPEKKP